MKKKSNFNINTWLPIIIFALIAVIFGIATRGEIFQGANLTNLFNQMAATLIAGLGMLFVAAMGGTDISCGVIVGLAACFSCLSAQSAGGWIMIPVCMAVGLISGCVLGFINAKFHVSSFMVSLSMVIAYRAFCSLVLGNNA